MNIESRDFGSWRPLPPEDTRIVPPPLPQTGVYAVEWVREQFGFSREKFEAACQTLGVAILPEDRVDLGALLAAVERHEKAGDQAGESGE